MTDYIERFKSELSNTILDLAGKTYVKIMLVAALFSLLSNGVSLIILENWLGLDLTSMSNTMGNSFEDILKKAYPQEDLGFDFFLGMFVFSLVMMIFTAWVHNVYFKVQNDYVLNQKVDLLDILKNSFDNNVLKIIGFFFLIGIIAFLAAVLSGLFAMISPLIPILLMLFMVILLLRFMIIIPAMIFGRLSFSEAINYSFKHITWSRAIKLFLLSIVIIIIAGLAMAAIGFIIAGISVIPVIGIPIGWILNVAVSAFFASLSVAVPLGLFYRYAEFEEETPDEENTQEELPLQSEL